jgi:hypothetical protein
MQALNFDIGEIVPALRAPGNLPSVQSKQADRDQIAWLTQQFLARGGQITTAVSATSVPAVKTPKVSEDSLKEILSDIDQHPPVLIKPAHVVFVAPRVPASLQSTNLQQDIVGSEQLLLDVRAGLLKRGLNLSQWCRDNAVSYSSAVGCLTHLRPRAAGLILRQQLLAAAGIKEGS